MSEKIINKKTLKKFNWSKMTDLTQIILSLVAAGGFLALAAAVPGVLQIIGQYQKWQKSYRRRNYVNKRLELLIKRGWLKIVETKETRRLELTKKGELELERYQTVNKILKTKWDGRWRIVAFDIWERRRRTRDQLRMELQELGFKKMQNSVWVSPYDCADFIYLLKTDLNLGRALVFFEVAKLESEKYWRERFDLD